VSAEREPLCAPIDIVGDRDKPVDRRACLFGTGAAGAAALATAIGARGASVPTNVAFVLSEGATVIDFAGPWEVFQDAQPSDASTRDLGGYRLFTVARDLSPIVASAGLKILPNYSFRDAPNPQIVVVPAQHGGAEVVNYLRAIAPSTERVVAVCTGAFQVGRAGLLDGLTATTHHDFYEKFEAEFPKARLVRGTRFIDHGHVATAGGLTSGIDLALHLVSNRMGAVSAAETARYMEYAGNPLVGQVDPR